MASYLFKGIFIGLLFGLPVGAVGAMTVQRAWSFGLRAGLLTGLGSSAADCLYAIIGAFGLTLISDFLLEHQTLITILGGTLILFMGIRLVLKKGGQIVAEEKPTANMKMFLSSFAIGITNPAAVLTFLFAFSYFGISNMTGIGNGVYLVCGVFIGTYLWWGALSAAACMIRKKAGNHGFQYLNQVFGSILTLFGIAVYLKII